MLFELWDCKLLNSYYTICTIIYRVTKEENCKNKNNFYVISSAQLILYLLINIYSLLLFSCKSNLIIPNRQIIKYANKSMNQTFANIYYAYN